MRAGWERWYVPDAVAVHDYQRVIDRTFLLASHVVAPARHGTLRAAPPGDGRAAFLSRPQAPFSIGTSTMLPHSVHEPS